MLQRPSEINFDTETRRSEILHELLQKVWGTNIVSPIEQELTKGKDFKVLDVGCGNSGILLLQLSKDYPLANFVGLDITPRFPKDYSQDNLQFIQGDVLEGLPFEDNSFDFVQMRFLLMEFTEEQWEEIVVKELVRVCKPGGWVEISDTEAGKCLGPTYDRMATFILSYLQSRGVGTIKVEDDVPEYLSNCDDVDEVHVDERIIPIGSWGGDIGNLALEILHTIFVEVSNNYLSVYRSKISNKEYEEMIEQYGKEANYYRSYFIFIKIYCQKAY